jgi:hypothetical protein
VPDRVGVDAEVAALAGQPPGAQRQGLRLGLLDVGHPDVEVELLRPLGVGPVRGLEVGRLLERDPVAGAGDHHPAVPGRTLHVHPQEVGVEASEGMSVGRVDHDGMELTDHGPILAAARGADQSVPGRGPRGSGQPGRRGRDLVTQDRGVIALLAVPAPR